MPPFQLQVIGEDNGFEITFNNGTLASANNNILNRILEKNETCHFVSNKPVMATLCRSVGNQKGFAWIPPVSSYGHQERLQLFYTSLTVTLNTLYMDIPSYVNGGWEYMYQSKYKVGRFWRRGSWYFTAIGQSKFSSIVFTFRPQTFYIDGLSLAEDEKPISYPTNAFIMVPPKSGYSGAVIVAIGEQEARYQVRCSGNDGIESRITHPYVADYFAITSHSVCFVETDNEHLHFFLQDTSRNRLLSVSLFPITSLGTEYVIPYYDVTINRHGLIMLATGNWTASVDVTIKDGIVVRYDLVEYQIVIVDNGVSGMIVSASREIAVFIENVGNVYRYMYAQLIPSEDFGNEYVLAAGSITINKFRYIHNLTEEYYINITCLEINTTINFTNGVVATIGKTKFYHKDVFVNETLHFTTSKPVMAYLCLKIEFHRNNDVYQENPCTILPPVERYDDSAVINIPSEADLKIMTKKDNADVHAYTVNYMLQNTTFTFIWENIPNSDFKVGTATKRQGIIFLKSTQRFFTVMFGYRDHSSPRYYTSFNIYTSPPSLHQRTPRLSTKADTPMDHQQTTDADVPSAGEKTPGFSSVNAHHEEGLNSDGNVVMDGDNDVTTLIVGCVCGFIILVLGCIVGFLVIRMKRNAESESNADPQNRHSAPQQPTTFEMDRVTRVRGQGTGAEGNTYSDMTLEGNVVNPYANVVYAGQNRENPLRESNRTHGNTYSDLTLNRQTEDDYDIVDHVKQETDYVNM